MAIISEPGHTRNKKYTVYDSSEEMMHEVNVIRGPGGYLSLFVNVSQAEICPGLTVRGGRIIISLPSRNFCCGRCLHVCLTEGPHHRERSVSPVYISFLSPFFLDSV